MYGRRRVGKTRLLNEFRKRANNKKHSNCRSLGNILDILVKQIEKL